VEISSLATTDTFDVNGVEYTLTFDGFRKEISGKTSTSFKSDEGFANERLLVGSFTQASAAAPIQTVTPVPVPAALPLFIGALGLFAGLARRR